MRDSCVWTNSLSCVRRRFTVYGPIYRAVRRHLMNIRRKQHRCVARREALRGNRSLQSECASLLYLSLQPVCLRKFFIINVIILFNPLMGRLTPHSNGPLYSNMVISTLAVDGWAVTFGTARNGLGGLRPRPVPSPLYQM